MRHTGDRSGHSTLSSVYGRTTTVCTTSREPKVYHQASCTNFVNRNLENIVSVHQYTQLSPRTTLFSRAQDADISMNLMRANSLKGLVMEGWEA